MEFALNCDTLFCEEPLVNVRDDVEENDNDDNDDLCA